MPHATKLAQWLAARGKGAQAELARRSGLDESQICRYAIGERRPEVPAAFAIQRATDGEVPASYWETSKLRRQKKIRHSRKVA